MGDNKKLLKLAGAKNDNKTPKTPEDERDAKAKERVEKLLAESDINFLKKEDELIEFVTDSTVEKNNSWLAEQVATLTDENLKLRSEAETAREDYRKIFAELQNLKSGRITSVDGDVVKSKVCELFDELQENYISRGRHPITGAPNFIVVFPAFLERMILFFPFLVDRKRYQI